MWGVFVKKSGKWGGFSCKKVDLSSTQGALCTVSVFFYFTFYLFEGGAYAPNAPPCLRGARWVPPDLTMNHDDQARRYVGKVGCTIGL